MQISELVRLLEEGIKTKVDEFSQIEKEHATTKASFYNDLKALEQVLREHNAWAASNNIEMFVNDKVKEPRGNSRTTQTS